MGKEIFQSGILIAWDILRALYIWHLEKKKVGNAKKNIIMGCFGGLIVDLCFREVCYSTKQTKKCYLDYQKL